MLQLIPILLITIAGDFQPIDYEAATTLSFTQQIDPSTSNQSDTEEAQHFTPTSTWGTKDSWRWNIQYGYAKDVKRSENTLSTFGVEFEYFLEDDLSLDLGLLGMDVDQLGPNANGLNFTLLLRWHCIKKDSWSIFLEGGAGLLRTSNHVPTGGSSFNFTPQAGVGLTFDIGNNNRWLIGTKWHHVSNANTYDTNPGRDSIMIWTGISFPF